jgi:DNA-binding GntR family transcriptional regulator
MRHQIRDRACAQIGEAILTGRLPAGAPLDEGALATDVGVDAPVVREALCHLSRDGFVREEPDGGFAVSELDEAELREAYPIVLLLEGLAVRTTTRFPEASIVRLRELNGAMERAAGDPAAAARHDHDFHAELVSHCDNEQLLATLRPLKRTLLRYELAYMSIPDHVGASVRQHAAIADALERGDRDAAAALVEANFRETLPRLLERLAA